MPGVCSVSGCANPVRCKGLCNKHYHVLKNSRQMKPCACGCGELTPYNFKWGHHTRLLTSEEQARRGRHNDGSKQRDRGLCQNTYRKVGGRHEHRIVAEAILGRPLTRGEVVHHKDGNIRNNAAANLEVLPSQAEHLRQHHPEMLEARKAKHGY